MTRPGRSYSTHILVVLALTNLVSYAARNALFAVYPDLTARYGIDDAQIGLLQTVFMIPHAAATLGFGWAGDRFDRRRVIAVGMILASAAGALGAMGSSYLGLGISRALVGFGTAAVVPVANSILAQIFEGPQKASRLAVFNLGLFVGGVVGFAVGAALGFPLVVVTLAIPGVVLAAMVAMLPVPPPPALPAAIATSTDPAAARRTPWHDFTAMLRLFVADARVLLKIRTLRWVIASTTVMAFAAGAYNAWLKEFLVRDKGMSNEEATSLLALALCGGLSGILVGARISDRMRRRSPAGRLWVIVMGMALTAPCATVALLLPAGLALDVTGIATLFFISWYHAPMAATVDDLAPKRLAVAAQGLVIFTMHMVGTAPSSWVIGEISKHATLRAAMWIPTGALLVAAACMAVATRSFSADQQRARS
jgi:MFS family permease